MRVILNASTRKVNEMTDEQIAEKLVVYLEASKLKEMAGFVDLVKFVRAEINRQQPPSTAETE